MSAAPRFIKNAAEEQWTEVRRCRECLWAHGTDESQWDCTVHNRSVEEPNLRDGFPDFCELPDRVPVISQWPKKDGWRVMRHVCSLLNEALQVDRMAVDNLITMHTVCNEDLAHHPTIQVRQTFGKRFTVGPLGFLNGLSDGKHYIIAQYDDVTGQLVGFEVVEEGTLDKLADPGKTEEKLDNN